MYSRCCAHFPMIGKVLFALPFMVFGVMHLIYGDAMQGIVPAFIPGGVWWVYLTGVVMILSSLAILANMHAKKAALALAVLIATFILTIHIPGIMNPATMRMEIPNLLKDVSLLGGALLLAGYLARQGKEGCGDAAAACGQGMCGGGSCAPMVPEGCCGGGCEGCGDDE